MQKMFVANKALMVNKDGKVLLVKDSGNYKDHQAGSESWDLPGGRMDKEDRTLDEALLRELDEELGCRPDISDSEILATSLWSIRGDDDNRVTAIVYLVHVEEELEITLSPEHVDFGWFDPLGEIEGRLSPCLQQVLAAYKEKYA